MNRYDLTDHCLWHDAEYVVIGAVACGFRSQLVTIKSLVDGCVVTVLSDNVTPVGPRIVAQQARVLRLVCINGVQL